jgi:hypothetical protein
MPSMTQLCAVLTRSQTHCVLIAQDLRERLELIILHKGAVAKVLCDASVHVVVFDCSSRGNQTDNSMQ